MDRMTVPQLVIAGGPGSGKDKIIASILAKYHDRFHLLGETAGMMIRTHHLEPPFHGEDLAAWQVVIANTQVGAECMGQIMARRKNAFLLCNRGLPDGAGYLPDGYEEFLRYVGGSEAEHFGRYFMVIFLETTDARTYTLTTAPGTDGYNPDRFEDAEQARERGDRLKSVWIRHPNHRVVPAMPTIEQKFAIVSGHVDDFLRAHGRL